MSDLEAALAKINNAFGAGAMIRMSEDPKPVEVIPTGSIALNRALGIGGLPRGRIVEIFGPESSGKSTLCLHAVANAQKAGGTAVYIDVEHSLDLEYAKNLGVDCDSLLLTQPETGEQALEIMDMIVRSGEVSIVVVDSVAALLPRAELEGDVGDSHVGLLARLMSQAMRKMTGILHTTNTTAIFVNQLREKIGTMGYGPSETTTGGRALKFYSSVRLDTRRIATLTEGTDAVGNRTKVKVVKNKLAPPHRVCEFDITYGIGINHESEVLDLAVLNGSVAKAGSWFKYGEEKWQGKANAVSWLRANPEVVKEIEEKL